MNRSCALMNRTKGEIKDAINSDCSNGDGLSQVVLKGDGLSRVYEGGVTVYALRSAAFQIQEGEFTVVLGPSGSGKSTLLNLIGGMDRPTGGTLKYKERELTALTGDGLAAYRRDSVGFVFQFFNLIPSLTAKENVELAASIVKAPMDPQKALEMVGLGQRAGHFPAQLSGGEQQRVSIARAIVKNPGLLLCDEPTGALDTANSAAVVKLLLDMRDRLGCPVVVITHERSIAKIADRVIYMRDGEIEHIEANENPLGVEEIQW